jgi:uncharacterized membrane protein
MHCKEKVSPFGTDCLNELTLFVLTYLVTYVPVKQVSTFKIKIPDKKMTLCNKKSLIYTLIKYLVYSPFLAKNKDFFSKKCGTF